jgi:hypothetical protein
MNELLIPLVDWSNGIIMIGIFAAVVVLLIVVVLNLMYSSKEK